MSVEWYDMIARRNGGYKSNAIFTKEGVSGEDEFEKRLIEILPNMNSVLDMGCGHGEFTIKMSKYAKSIIGADNSIELIKLAQDLKEHYKPENLEFVYATTKKEMPFNDEQFDLIYVRRGPTSILRHPRILKTGGTVFGIHTWDLDLEYFKNLMDENGFINFSVEVFDDAIMYFPNKNQFGIYLAACHGNPDYTLPEYNEELNNIINQNMVNGRIAWKECRYIWKANKR